MPTRSQGAHAAQLATCVAAYAVGVEPEGVLNRKKGTSDKALVRHLAIYLASVGLSMTHAQIASAFRRDRSTVSYACRRVENWRDDAAFDLWIEQFERLLREAPEPASCPMREAS